MPIQASKLKLFGEVDNLEIDTATGSLQLADKTSGVIKDFNIEGLMYVPSDARKLAKTVDGVLPVKYSKKRIDTHIDDIVDEVEAAQAAADIADGKAVTAQAAADIADGKAVTAQAAADIADGKASAAQAEVDAAHTDEKQLSRDPSTGSLHFEVDGAPAEAGSTATTLKGRLGEIYSDLKEVGKVSYNSDKAIRETLMASGSLTALKTSVVDGSTTKSDLKSVIEEVYTSLNSKISTDVTATNADVSSIQDAIDEALTGVPSYSNNYASLSPFSGAYTLVQPANQTHASLNSRLSMLDYGINTLMYRSNQVEDKLGTALTGKSYHLATNETDAFTSGNKYVQMAYNGGNASWSTLDQRLDNIDVALKGALDSVNAHADTLGDASGTHATVAARLSHIQGEIDFIKDNTDEKALDSLVEIVAAFQNADGDLQTSITNLTTDAKNDRTLIRSELKTETDALKLADDTIAINVDRVHTRVGQVDARVEEVIGLLTSAFDLTDAQVASFGTAPAATLTAH